MSINPTGGGGSSPVWNPIKNVYTKAADGKWHPLWTYSWATSGWGKCSAVCGGGIKTRTRWCRRVQDNVVRPDVFCNGITPPALTQTCNTHTCEVCWTAPGNCNYCWSWTRVYTSMPYARDSTWTGPGNYWVVGQFTGRQWVSGNNWGCGRKTMIQEKGQPLLSKNTLDGPCNGSVSKHTFYCKFSKHHIATEEEVDDIENRFQIYLQNGQCHWDGYREICVVKAILTKDPNQYPMTTKFEQRY